MQLVTCEKQECPYRKDGFCDKQFIQIGAHGACNEWYSKNGIQYQEPYTKGKETCGGAVTIIDLDIEKEGGTAA